MMNEKTLSVSQLNGLIKDVLNMGFPNAVWLCGEIQGYDRNRDKKHVFFELCEKDPVSHDVMARVGLVIFAGRKTYIEELLRNAQNAFALKDDIEVRLLCRVDFYPPHGAVRLVVESIDPVHTLGKIAQEKQRLIAQLRAKGILDKNKVLPLPELPVNVGLISSHDSAAYNDFLSELRASGLSFRVVYRNTLMQGKNAPADVCRAIDVLERIADLDVIVITRGGGSIAELSCFDSEAIATRIAQCSLPVLSGIGHEINITVTDLAAHTYQKTPTAIARFLVERVRGAVTAMDEKMLSLLELSRESIQGQRRRLQSAAVGLQSQTLAFVKGHHQTLAGYAERATRQPARFLSRQSEALSANTSVLAKSARQRLQEISRKLDGYAKMIEIADPKNTIRRGFSITRTADGKIVRRVKDVHKQTALVTQVLDGWVQSQVGSVKKEE